MSHSVRFMMKTGDVIRYVCDPKFNALSILNGRYHDFRKNSGSARDFVRHFNRTYLFRRCIRNRKKLSMFVEMLSNPEFIEDNLGKDEYTYRYHQEVIERWDTLKELYEQQISEIEEYNPYV